MSDKLKPCPFCGAEVKVDHELMRFGDGVVHPDNGCLMFLFVVDTIAWNKRPLEDAQVAEIERLTAENATLRAENARLADEVRRLEYYFPEAN